MIEFFSNLLNKRIHMSLQQQLLDDMKTAMKAKDTVKLGVVRFLRSEIKNYEIDHGEQDDAGVQQIIAREVKKMKDAMADFAKAGREDLVEEEEQKVVVMESYLPAQMSDEELEKIVKEVIDSAEDKNMGKMIGAVKAKVEGQADGGRIAGMVKKLLA